MVEQRSCPPGGSPGARTVRRLARPVRGQGGWRHIVPSTETLLAIFVGGGLVAEAVVRATTATIPSPDVDTLGLVATPAFVAALFLVARLALSIGPVIALPAEVGWLLSTPVDRRAILARRIVVTAVGGAFAGFLIGLGHGLLAADASLPGSLVMGTAGGWCCVAVGMGVQSLPTQQQVARRVVDGCLVLLAIVFVAALSIPQQLETVLAALGSPTGWSIGMGNGAIVISVVTFGRLGRLDRRALTAEAPIVAALGTATSFLDPKVFGEALLRRQCARIAMVRSRRLGNRPTGALVRAELTRVVRRPGIWVIMVVTTLLVYAGWRTMPPAVAVTLHVVACVVVVRPFSRGLEQVCRSGALRFALGLSDRYLRAVHLLLPVGAALSWSVVTAPAAGVAAAVTVPLGAVGAVVTSYRWATRPDPEYTGTFVDTPLGSMPADLLRQVLRGHVLLIVVCALAVVLVTS